MSVSGASRAMRAPTCAAGLTLRLRGLEPCRELPERSTRAEGARSDQPLRDAAGTSEPDTRRMAWGSLAGDATQSLRFWARSFGGSDCCGPRVWSVGFRSV